VGSDVNRNSNLRLSRKTWYTKKKKRNPMREKNNKINIDSAAAESDVAPQNLFALLDSLERISPRGVEVYT